MNLLCRNSEKYTGIMYHVAQSHTAWTGYFRTRARGI